MVRAAGTLAGRYDLVEVIGRGGMGVVYRGRDRTLDRTVAVKVLPALFAENPTLVERFEREARAAASLNHPNIVSVFDSGRDGTERFIVMECVPGVSLAELLRERGRLEVREAVALAAQIAGALAAAHAAGIVHRDVKPANVMVLPSGGAKVLDFGIARAAADAALTNTSMVLGSAPYIAPEVMLGQAADERSDIYSLGCVLYEMLTGRPPFVGDLPAVVMNQHTNAAPQPIHELAEGIPPALAALVMRMLAKNPVDRPRSAADLTSALKASLTAPTAPTQVAPAPLPTAATAAATAAGPPAASPEVATSPAGEPDPGRTGAARRAWILATVLILALAAGVAAALVSSSGSSSSQSSTGNSSRAFTAPPSSSTAGRPASTSTTASTTTRSSTTSASNTATSSGTTTATKPATTTTTSSGSASTTTTVP